MGADEAEPDLKDSLTQQAAAYRKLAGKRAAEMKLPPVNLPAVPPENNGRP